MYVNYISFIILVFLQNSLKYIRMMRCHKDCDSAKYIFYVYGKWSGLTVWDGWNVKIVCS